MNQYAKALGEHWPNDLEPYGGQLLPPDVSSRLMGQVQRIRGRYGRDLRESREYVCRVCLKPFKPRSFNQSRCSPCSKKFRGEPA